MLSEGIRNVFKTFLKMPSRYKRVVTDVYGVWHSHSTSLTTLFTFFQNQITFKGDSVKKVIENSLKGDIKWKKVI